MMSGTKNGLVHPGARSALTSVLLLLRLVPAREVCKRIIKQETTTDDVYVDLDDPVKDAGDKDEEQCPRMGKKKGGEEESGKVSARVLVEVPVAGGTPGRTQVVLQGSRRVTQLQVINCPCIASSISLP